MKSEPELLARHYTEAGSAGKAVTYWQRAGENALQRSANLEATAHLAKGLEVLRAVPDGPERAQRELDLLTTMGPALTATKGYAAPEAGIAYRRALELCQDLGDTTKQFSSLHGLWHLHYNRAELDAARSLAEQLVDVAKGRQDPGLDLAAYRALGYTLNDLGELEASRSCLERVITSYDPAVHGGYAFRHGGSDPGVGSLSIGAWGVWALGYPDQALGQNAAGLALARKLAHPLSEAWALTSAAAVHQLRGEPKAAQERAEGPWKSLRKEGLRSGSTGRPFCGAGRGANRKRALRRSPKCAKVLTPHGQPEPLCGRPIGWPCWRASMAGLVRRRRGWSQSPKR